MNIVILTGAGISAESGIKTFRDTGGLWEGHDVMEVATPEGWTRNRPLVLEFYNQRRKQALEVSPNAAHKALVELEQKHRVDIITQNVDNLHERAGSSNVLHLHGELSKSRSSIDPKLVYDIKGWELKEGDTCEKGSQLRPHIVWFGEAVPAMDLAIPIVQHADVLIVIGTSLQVYPAAGLIDYIKPFTKLYVIDPKLPSMAKNDRVNMISTTATVGVPQVVRELID